MTGGAPGASKLLCRDAAGNAMVARAAMSLVAGGASPVVVVLGHAADEVAAVLGELGEAAAQLILVRNPYYAEGMASSIRAGLAALPAGVEACLIGLGDMPLLRAGTVAGMMCAFAQAEQPRVVAPAYEGQRGNPVLWPRAWFGQLAALAGDAGAREVLAGLGEKLLLWPCGDAGVVQDFDSPEGLALFAASVPDGGLRGRF